jgi:hypothetical protein
MGILNNRLTYRAGNLLLGVSLLTIAGCGDDTGIGKRYSVYGTVQLKGKPLEKGRIDFHPVDADKSRPASGEIKDGSYTLTTLTSGDGALPGAYKVTITAKDVDNAQVIDTIKKKGGGGRQHEIAKAHQAAKSIVPSKYALAETSGLNATVEERSNKKDFELTEQ